MNRSLSPASFSHAGWRAVIDTGAVVAVAVVFVLAWAIPSISDGARRFASFAAAILFVVFFHEAARSWRIFRAERNRPAGRQDAPNGRNAS